MERFVQSINKVNKMEVSINPKKKNKILITVPHFTSSASPYREMMALAKYLPEEGYSPTICALRKNGIEETGPLLDNLGIPYFYAKFRVKKISQISNLLKAEKQIKNNGPFLLQHSFDFTSLPLEAIVARLNGRKFIHQQRNLNEGGYTFLLKIKLLLSNKIIACAPNNVGFLTNNFVKQEKIQMIPLGIDLNDPQPKQNKFDETGQSKVPKLLMVSNLVPRKRIEDAINACADLMKDYPSIQLNVIGATHDSSYKESIDLLIKQRNLQKNVNLLGSFPNPEVLAAMGNADIFIHCAEHEAFGWVFLEAFSQRLPVVAANSEGASDIIHDGINGFLFPVGNIAVLVEKTRALLNNLPLRERVTNNAIMDVQQTYSARKMVKRIAAVYDRVLQNDTNA